MNILSPNKTVKKAGISRVTIWRLEKAGKFPKRVNLTDSRVGWIESEIEEWLQSRPRGICNREIRREVGI